MTDSELGEALKSAREIEITVIGRKTRRQISLPVWFVHDAGRIQLLPVYGSDTNWYKNLLATTQIQVLLGNKKHDRKAMLVSDAAKVAEIADKFRAKYSPGEIKKYYSKLDVAIEIPA